MATISFSRFFPAYHPKAKSPTFFVEKILKSIEVNYECENYLDKLCTLNTKNLANGKLSFEDIESFYLSLQTKDTDKGHTVRAGNRWEVGNKFSPRCWFGKPYKSPQIIFWEDIEVKKVWGFEINNGDVFIDNKVIQTNFNKLSPKENKMSDELKRVEKPT